MDSPSGKAPAYNLNNPSVKRLLKEYRELQKEASDQFTAAPLEEDIFEFHFTIRGPPGTDFEGGIYHGRILLPQDYPFKPPDFVFLTPNGRFEVGKKICLTVTSYHSESWQPSWSTIIGFMPTKAEGAIGGLDYSTEERKKLATQSMNWKCDKCGMHNNRALPDTPPPNPLSLSSTTLAASSDDIRSSGPALRVSQITYTMPQSPVADAASAAASAPSASAASAAASATQHPVPPSTSVAAAQTQLRRPVSPGLQPASPELGQQLPGTRVPLAPQRDTKFLDTAILSLIALIIALLWAKWKDQ